MFYSHYFIFTISIFIGKYAASSSYAAFGRDHDDKIFEVIAVRKNPSSFYVKHEDHREIFLVRVFVLSLFLKLVGVQKILETKKPFSKIYYYRSLLLL